MIMMDQLKTENMSSLERKYNLRNGLLNKQIIFLKGPYCCGKKFLLNTVCEEFKFTTHELELDVLNFHSKYKIIFFPGTRFKPSDIIVIHHIEWFDEKDQRYILEKITNIPIPVVVITTDFFKSGVSLFIECPS
jgi:hypothetical protein